MKSILFIPLFLLIFCRVSFAQTNKISSCPTVSISNTTIPEPEGYVVYTASLSEQVEPFKVQYNWTVQHGKIVSGQGTSTAKFKIDSTSLNVSVQITGLPEKCPNTASESFVIDFAQQRQFAEFSISVSQINKNSLDSLAAELQNNPAATAYVFEYFRQNTSQKLIKQKIQKITDYLLREKGINKDRIVILTKRSSKNSTKIFIASLGADAPDINDNYLQ
jgi:hypothetical protein